MRIPMSSQAWLWWAFLTTVSFGNVAFLAGIWKRHWEAPGTTEHTQLNQYRRKLRWASVVYVVACFERSVWPRIDVERICFFESVLSITFVGRSLATVAELCFAWQIALVLDRLAADLQDKQIQRMIPSPCPAWKLRWIRVFANIIVPAIAVAQTCCWLGVTTTRQVWHAVEESIWMMFVALLTPCAVTIAQQCRLVQCQPGSEPRDPQNPQNSDGRYEEAKEPCHPSLSSRFRTAAQFGTVIGVIGPVFVIFMCSVDIPMYITRWQADEDRGLVYLSFSEGLLDSMACKEIAREWTIWAEDVPWMSAYFSFAVWGSLWMADAAPCLRLH